MKPSVLPRLFGAVLLACLITACGGGGGGGGGNSAPVTPVFVDSDKDGVADSEDAVPTDALCSASSDASNGQCFLRTLVSARLKVVGNAEGKIFFSAEGDALMLYAYDLKTKHFLGRASMVGYTPTTYAYVPAHARFYVGDTNGNIHAFTESLVESATPFAKTPLKVAGLSAAGKYLMAQDATGPWATHYIYDKDGKLTQSKDWNYYSSAYEWSAAQSRLYFFRDDTSPDDLQFEVIDQSTGLISSAGETPYHGAYSILGPIRANAAGTKVLLGSGDIYQAPALTWAGKIASSFSDAMWLANDELVVAGANAGGTRLARYSVDRVKIEELQLDGDLLALAQQGSNSFVILKKSTQVDIVAYVPSNDSDGDGVDNLTDRFPLDKAAAVDSDGDGYPDAWLAGKSAADSTTGLTLDAYPQDASCHLLEQGDGTHCNPALSAPPAVPEKVLSDGKGTLFLFSRSSNRIYRWSAATGNYLSPLAVGSSAATPITIAYSADQQRLYLGYASGQINYLDLAAGNPSEKPFGATAASVQGLAGVGKYVLAQDGSGAWATHYIFDKNGLLTDSKDWNYFSNYYDWAPNQSRAYFFRDDQSPNDVMFEEINQSTGKITGAGETPYHGNYLIQGPIRVSLGGGRIVLGSGDIYSTSDLTIVTQLHVSLTDMQWLADGSLLTLSRSGSNTLLTAYTSGFAVRSQQLITGQPIALVMVNGGGAVVVTNVGGLPQITPLSASIF